MNKYEAKSSLDTWLVGHSGEQWTVVKSDLPHLRMYAATATIDEPDVFANHHIEIKYEDE